jgi:hypothetical protein
VISVAGRALCALYVFSILLHGEVRLSQNPYALACSLYLVIMVYWDLCVLSGGCDYVCFPKVIVD